MAEIVTKATIALKNSFLIAKDDGKEESHGGCETHTRRHFAHTVASHRGCAFEKYLHMHTWFCYLVQSLSRGWLRDRNALMLEGKEAFFHMDFYRASTVKRWEPVGMWAKKKERKDEGGLSIYERGRERERADEKWEKNIQTSTRETNLQPFPPPSPLAFSNLSHASTPTCWHGDVTE